MNKPLSPFLALAAASLGLVSGCFPQAAPDKLVTATSLEEAARLGAGVECLDLSAAPRLAAFPEGIAAHAALRKLSLRGQPAAAALPAAIGSLAALESLDLLD